MAKSESISVQIDVEGSLQLDRTEVDVKDCVNVHWDFSNSAYEPNSRDSIGMLEVGEDSICDFLFFSGGGGSVDRKLCVAMYRSGWRDISAIRANEASLRICTRLIKKRAFEIFKPRCRPGSTSAPYCCP